MGDAAVSALVKEVLGRLTSELIKEFALFRGFKGDILALKEDFEQIQAVLEDAEEKQVKEKAVELWLRPLRPASLKVGELRHGLGCLQEEYSWLLFKKHAFAQGRVGDDVHKLEPIEREIVVKCKGLPLAVKTLGSLMWSKRSIEDWRRVKDSNIWKLQENKVLPALKLSYDNLVPHLKSCFSYFCLFPKVYTLKKDELILLWVANGFIPPREETDLYVIGEEILNCLIWKSLFQVEDGNKYLDGINRCKMHDLVHDMAQHVMKHDCLVIEPACNEVKIIDEVLHLSSSCSDEKLIISSEDIEKLTSLRSIFMFGEGDEGCISQLFNHLRYLYVRVLHLALTKLRTLPESFEILENKLEVLELVRCDKLISLPCNLPSIRELIIEYCDGLLSLPDKIQSFKDLNKLVVSNIDGWL